MSKYGDRTIVNDDTFDEGVKVRHVFWGFFWVIVALLGLSLIGWGVMGNEFFLYKFFAPLQEAVRRQVFEESKAYNQGQAQTIHQYQMQYIQASEEHKAALKASILHQTADFDTDRIPPHLATWLKQLRAER